MLLIVIVALVFGSLIFRNRTVLEGTTTEVIEPSVKTVRASVDGKPVHSYVLEQ